MCKVVNVYVLNASLALCVCVLLLGVGSFDVAVVVAV